MLLKLFFIASSFYKIMVKLTKYIVSLIYIYGKFYSSSQKSGQPDRNFFTDNDDVVVHLVI